MDERVKEMGKKQDEILLLLRNLSDTGGVARASTNTAVSYY